MPLLIAVLALAGFGAIVWYAYSWGTGEVPPDELPIVQADRDLSEVKERPDDPGGMEVPHQDAQVLNDRNGVPDGGVERLLPGPETPQPPAPASVPAPETQQADSASATTGTSTEDTPADAQSLPEQPPAPPQISDPPVEAPPAVGGDTVVQTDETAIQVTENEPLGPQDASPAAQETAPAAEPAPEAPAAPTAETAAVPPPAAPQPEQPATPPAPAPETAPETAPAAAPAAAPASATVQAGDWVLQMAALRDPAAAEAEWARLQAANPDLLGGLSLAVQAVEVAGRGTFYRVQGGPLPNQATAADLCRLLQAQGTDCLVKQH